jgi:hypothetical protein
MKPLTPLGNEIRGGVLAQDAATAFGPLSHDRVSAGSAGELSPTPLSGTDNLVDVATLGIQARLSERPGRVSSGRARYRGLHVH